MTTYAVTGASGPFGNLAVHALLRRGVPAHQVVAIARTVAKAQDLAALGVVIRHADYDQPETLAGALEGVDALLLVSGSEVGRRVPQHTAAVEAAVAAGATKIAYTSVLHAAATQLVLAPEHRATEELMLATGLDVTFLRNSWYAENYTSQLTQYLATGAIVHAAGSGRVAAASRADYAEAAAVVLTTNGHKGRAYELGGDSFSMKELAEAVTDVTGTPVIDREVSPTELVQILREHAGLPEATALFVTSLDEALGRGELDTGSGDLARLLGRPATPLATLIRAAL